MQFSAIVNRFIVKTYRLNSAFTNDLKRKFFFSKNVHSCRLSLFKFITKHTITNLLQNAAKYCWAKHTPLHTFYKSNIYLFFDWF